MEETDGKKCTDGDNDTREVKFHDFCFDDAKIQKITIKEEKKTYNNSFSLFYGCVSVLQNIHVNQGCIESQVAIC